MSAKPRKPRARKPVGRPSAYRQAYAEQGFKLALLGLIDKEMADFFGVGEATINRWKLAHPEFRESIKRGKIEADSQVAASLYQAALGGGALTEEKVQTDAEGNLIGRTTETRQLPASTTAMIFWLKNRQPDKWRDKIESNHEITLHGPSGEELYRLFSERMRQARERQAAVLAERGIVIEGEMNHDA